MSLSATLYRVSYVNFKELKESNYIDFTKIEAITKDNYTFQGSFMAIEFILAKGQDQKTTSLVKEIFQPAQELGYSDMEDLSMEDQLKMYDPSDRIPYLDSYTISRFNEFLLNFSDTDVHSKYDPKELNDAGIYPRIWHNDNAPNLAFNKLHILEDIAELKKIFELADKEMDYILVMVG